jgi:hypothetical protein
VGTTTAGRYVNETIMREIFARNTFAERLA